MSNLSLNSIRKAYGPLDVIHGIDLEVKSGEFIVFVGPSGCGKSTLLRMIAGLENITGGEIIIGGKVVNHLPSVKRGIAMVFQSYALYPHMTVFDNMGFGLKLAKKPPEEIKRRVEEAARILQIEHYLDRMPKALSGGQRQRVAIGRAIVRDPQIFLFDEPLSNLDAALRSQTRVEIAKLHSTLKSTMIYVTHDQVEAMTLADRIVVLNEGQVEQIGTPLELYSNPVNTFVAGFIANQRMNLLPVKPARQGEETWLTLPNGQVWKTNHPNANQSHTLGIRPEHMVATNQENALFSGCVDVLEQFGEYTLAYVSLPDGSQITAKLDGAPDMAQGTPLHFTAKTENVHLFNQKGASLRHIERFD